MATEIGPIIVALRSATVITDMTLTTMAVIGLQERRLGLGLRSRLLRLWRRLLVASPAGARHW
jgi:hypothetical protein